MTPVRIQIRIRKKRKRKNGLPLNTEEKEWLLLMANFVYREEEGERPEQGEEPSREVESKIQKSANLVRARSSRGNMFSDDDSDWNNNMLCEAKTWQGMNREVKETEELENHLPELAIRVLNKYRSRAPYCGPLMNLFPDPAEKGFWIKKYDKELKKQEIVLDFIMKAKGRKNELWNGSSDEEGMILTTVEESKAFVILAMSDNDDQTVQGEKDLLKPLFTINKKGVPCIYPSNLFGTPCSREPIGTT
ncbi:16429_t:CDS:2 [Gigaspora margarita]|uniref:16429_t:CDS:1 n=1 Tax=Gigaspora margarita TaxID=4874 RepID=A0ABN7V4U2_GIGMA|nr:16429_t:CDS:2 [Gigaspora margarita]